MSENLERAKQAVREFYEKQREPLNKLASLNDEEQKIFHPWYMSYNNNQ